MKYQSFFIAFNFCDTSNEISTFWPRISSLLKRTLHLSTAAHCTSARLKRTPCISPLAKITPIPTFHHCISSLLKCTLHLSTAETHTLHFTTGENHSHPYISQLLKCSQGLGGHSCVTCVCVVHHCASRPGLTSSALLCLFFRAQFRCQCDVGSLWLHILEKRSCEFSR